jgi:hypothetical protein
MEGTSGSPELKNARLVRTGNVSERGFNGSAAVSDARSVDEPFIE